VVDVVSHCHVNLVAVRFWESLFHVYQTHIAVMVGNFVIHHHNICSFPVLAYKLFAFKTC